jgi:hypothetical protein
MRNLTARTVVPALTVCALTLSACSAASNHPNSSPGTPVNATTTDAANGSGRTLTRAQLLDAGLQASQWPNDITRLLDSGSAWEASSPTAFAPPQPPPACQPLVNLIWGTTGSSAAADVKFQRYNDAILGTVSLASYPQGQAGALFASVRHAASACPGFTASNPYGTVHDKIVPLQGPHLGDESISFGVTRDVNGTEFLDRYDYVRVGAATVLIGQVGDTAAVPPVIPTLLAPQVAKLRAAQS